MCDKLEVFCFAFVLLSWIGFSDETTLYQSGPEKSETEAAGYTKTVKCSARNLLAFRDIPAFMVQYVRGKKALDYGCGTGFSMQFLQQQGFDVTGADISEEMLTQARAN